MRSGSAPVRTRWTRSSPGCLAPASGHVHEDRPLQIMYGVGGERDLAERELPHLRGHRGSRPVRVGNGAWNQVQLDIFGEFIDAYSRYAGRLREPDAELAHFLADLADAAAARWQGRGSGIWEARSGRQHYFPASSTPGSPSTARSGWRLRLAPATGWTSGATSATASGRRS
jgi:GH15 family glucan-1,4-alpha-glucosidase